MWGLGEKSRRDTEIPGFCKPVPKPSDCERKMVVLFSLRSSALLCRQSPRLAISWNSDIYDELNRGLGKR